MTLYLPELKKICLIQTNRETDEWTAFPADDPKLAVWGIGPQATLGLLMLAVGDKFGIKVVRLATQGLRLEIEVPTASDREELAGIVRDTVTYVMTDITSDFGPVADAIIANGWRKQKPK